MGDVATARSPYMDEPRCYNCGMTGHQTVACPEPTRTVPAGLEEHRRRQASSKELRHKSRGKHQYASSSSASSQSRHSNGMVVTRYPLPPSAGEPQITRYPAHQQLPHLPHLPHPPHLPPPPPPSVSLLPPAPPPENGGSYHGYQHSQHPQHHHHHQKQHQPGPDLWAYPPPQQPAYPGPHPSAHYDAFGQSLPATSSLASRPGLAADSSYYSQSYPPQPQPGYFASPPPGVTGPSVIPPSSFSGPYFPQPPPLAHPLPAAPHHQLPPSGPSKPGASEPYSQHDFGRSLPQLYPPYGSPPTNLPNPPKYPQGSGSGNGWRPGKRGDFAGQHGRGGRSFLGKDRGRKQHPGSVFRHVPPEHAIGVPSVPRGPAALSRRFAAAAPTPASSERRAPGNEAAPSHLVSPAKPNGIPAKPPTPISMSRSGFKKNSRPQEAARRTAEQDQTSSQGSPYAAAVGSSKEYQDPYLSSQKRTNDSHLAVGDDDNNRGIKRTRPSSTDTMTAPISRQDVASSVAPASVVPVVAVESAVPSASAPLHVDGEGQDDENMRAYNFPSSRNSLPNPPITSPWSGRPPNRVLTYGTPADRDSSGASTRHDSGYHSNDGAEPPLVAHNKEGTASMGHSAPNGFLAPASSLPSHLPTSGRGRESRSHSSFHSRSHSSSQSHNHDRNQSNSHSRSHSRSRSRSRSRSQSRSRSRSRGPDRSPARHIPHSPPEDSRRGRSGFSRSRSSSPLDDLELAMLGMVRPESDEDGEGLKKLSEKTGGNQKTRKRPPKVAPAYSRRW